MAPAQRDALIKEWVELLWSISSKEGGAMLDEKAFKEALMKKLTRRQSRSETLAGGSELERFTPVSRPEKGDRHPARVVFLNAGASDRAVSQSPFSSSVSDSSVNRYMSPLSRREREEDLPSAVANKVSGDRLKAPRTSTSRPARPCRPGR